MKRWAAFAVTGLTLAGCGAGSDTDRTPAAGAGGPAPTAAAPTLDEVKAGVRRGLVSIDAYSGELVQLHGGPVDGAAATERRAVVLATAAGDHRETVPGGFVTAYDARRGIERHLGPPDSSAGTGSERRGLSPGPPDMGRGVSEQQDVTLLARLLLDLDVATVAQSSFENRPAWLVPAATRNSFDLLAAEEVALTVDRASGMVVRAVGTTKGQFTMEIRLENLVVDPPVDSSMFDLPVPPGASVHVDDVGFRRLPLEEVAGAAGYDPLVPSAVPEGYRLVEVAYAERATGTGSDANPNPPSRQVVSLAFHRGFQRLVVTTRLRGGHVWADPHGYSTDADANRVPAEPVNLTGGALSGVTAEVVSRIPEAWGRSQLWAMTDRLVVTVGGDVDRDELLAVAESLQP
jgi:hypothetical protein